MPRPISWLPRLQDIRRSVEQSVRSHYTRSDLEKLFELQPRAAGQLLAVMEKTRVGAADLVAKDTLLQFLEQVREAEDVPALLQVLRDRGSKPSYKKLRHLVRSDLPPVSLDEIPAAITLERGRIAVQFESTEGLAESMLQIAWLLRDHGDEFTVRYEPVRVNPEVVAAREEMAGLFAGLRRMEAEHAKKNAGRSKESDRRSVA